MTEPLPVNPAPSNNITFINGKMFIPNGNQENPPIYFGDDSNTGMYSSAENNLSFTTDGVRKMNIDPSGNVTKQFNSAFYYFLQDTIEISTPYMFSNLTKKCDNNNNGFFTCPVSGFYQFNAHISIGSITEGITKCQILIYKNNVPMATLVNINPYPIKNADNILCVSASYACPLSQGDVITFGCIISENQIVSFLGSDANNGDQTFCYGFLLS